ncbi:MAG: YmdB family metallophosphoesterase [Candidatus Improbicoccus pseudotrichonymphae]|uniref:YmdB family metallophosphoesterase n=1 Tax=Candidatus Improbicoccus pseudotrichonymphae TaxID=3033792 RepID=A0AA48L151_9FIRM|nr:MAG: YmdB family metallophosphoesterase [Candidatus Improbicoccus pseudotrichonymphae]
MKILFIGDVVGLPGCRFIKNNLMKIKGKYSIDVTIANGENASQNNGITASCAEYIFGSGVDIITTGNHIFKQKKSICEYLKNNKRILRPANYPKNTPGNGMLKFVFNNTKFCVINILGTVMLESLACPFETLDNILENTGDCLIKIVDFHAEATSEKRAFGFYASNKVSAVFGTHTHVQTSDAQTISPGDMAYITDVGMTGTADSVLGVKKEISISRLKEKMPLRFEHETKGACKMECVVAEFDETNGKALSIQNLIILDSDME